MKDGQALEASPKLEVYTNTQVVESWHIVLLWNSRKWLSFSLGELQSDTHDFKLRVYIDEFHQTSNSNKGSRFWGVEGCIPMHQGGWGYEVSSWRRILMDCPHMDWHLFSAISDPASIRPCTKPNNCPLCCLLQFAQVHDGWQCG